MKSDLSNSELRRLDLTLLLVFLGLLRHGKATAVATELGLTPSAVSQAIKRLREIFGDPLFMRRPYGMEPTAVALALETPVRDAVEGLRAALGELEAFDPATASGIVRIGALDAEQAVLIPPIAARLRQSSSGLMLSVLPYGRDVAVSALIDRKIDFAIGYIWTAPPVISRLHLYDEDFLVAGPTKIVGHRAITLDAYCSADHVLVSPGGDMTGVVDDSLSALGLTRRVVLALPAFLPALAAAAESDAIVTLPRRVACRFASGFGLSLAEPPLEIRRFPIELYWHSRAERDPRGRWIRGLIEAAASASRMECVG